MIKEVYVIKNDNAKGSSWHTQIRKRNLNKELASRKDNFALIDFDPDDRYVVVDDKRYYLSWQNAIAGYTRSIIDIDELEKAKAYDFDPKYKTDTLKIFESFDQLRKLAVKRYDKIKALPQLTIERAWDPENEIDGYKETVN